MALIFAGGLTYLIFRRLRATAPQPKLTQIVAASKDLAPGVNLTAQDLTLIDWPDNVPLAGSLNKIDAAVGRPVMFSIGAKQPILERYLAVAGSGFGLSGRIPTGMRATAVRSNEIVGVAGFLFPGSHVDVLATYAIPGGNSSVTQTVLQNVEVLTAGTSTEPDPQGKPQTVSVVTLLLTPEDSQRLLLISGQGSIQFVLRSGVDQAKVDLPPTRLDQLLRAASPPSPPVAKTRTAPRPRPEVAVTKPVEVPKPPEVHVLEVIQGTQRNIQKF